MRRLAAVLALTVTGCGGVPDIQTSCVALTTWTDADQDRLKAAYDGLPAGSILRRAVGDWADMRAADRACLRGSEQ